MMMPVDVVNQTPMVESVVFPMVAPSPRKSGANPRYETSQPDSATHCRIQRTKPDITTVKATPPPKTRLWKT